MRGEGVEVDQNLKVLMFLSSWIHGSRHRVFPHTLSSCMCQAKHVS